jgi:hypothetical protein
MCGSRTCQMLRRLRTVVQYSGSGTAPLSSCSLMECSRPTSSRRVLPAVSGQHISRSAQVLQCASQKECPACPDSRQPNKLVCIVGRLDRPAAACLHAWMCESSHVLFSRRGSILSVATGAHTVLCAAEQSVTCQHGGHISVHGGVPAGVAALQVLRRRLPPDLWHQDWRLDVGPCTCSSAPPICQFCRIHWCATGLGSYAKKQECRS